MLKFTSPHVIEGKKWQRRLSFGVKTFLMLFLGTFLFSQISQAQSPCNAHRWEAGDGWRFDNAGNLGIITSNAQNLPLGIVRCASSAETESQLERFKAAYKTTAEGGFTINSLPYAGKLPCFSQQTETRGVSVAAPTPGEEIVWFNFDIRPLAGTYQFQIVTNENVGWALFYVDPAQAGPPPTGSGSYPASATGVSGNCNNLLYADCGVSGNGWSTITVPSFTKPSNYYLAMWMADPSVTTFSNSMNLVYKSRYGCGGATCTLEKFGNDQLNCNNDGTYTVCATYFGSAGKWAINAAGASSYTVTTYDQFNNVVTNAETNPQYLELGTISGTSPQNDIKAVICATYASGTNYSVTLTPAGLPSDAPNNYITCESSGAFNGTGLTTPAVTPGSYGPYCVNDAAVTLSGTPSGGTWSGPGVSGNTFNPATAGVGTHTLTYSVAATSSSCANSNTTQVTVKSFPTVTPGSYGPVCVNGAEITLGGTPSGGTWSGPGVSGNTFNPATAGVGTHTLTYSVAATSTACANSNSTQITVNPLATVTPGSYGPVCVNGAAVTLGGTPTGGIWSGPGVSGNSFNPATAGLGTHTLTYSVAATSTACANSNTTQITVNGRPTVGVNSPTICEGESITLTATGATSYTWSPSTGLSATTGTSVTASPASTTVYTVTGTDGNSCTNTANSTVTVTKCSRIELLKHTNGAVDATKTWSFTISGSDLPGGSVTQSVLNDADGILFDDLVLSKSLTYTICETNVPSGYTVTFQYQDANGTWQNIPAYDPNVVNGGGDFNQGEAMGNYCFKIGAGGIPFPSNTYGGTAAFLRMKINNIAPPGGNARTPGYWKNWNRCTGGNQVQTAAKNGGSAKGFWLLDDLLATTPIWTATSTTTTCKILGYQPATCEEAIKVLSSMDVKSGKVKSSDAAYTLAKHLYTYLLNKGAGTYTCQAADDAAKNGQALLAGICFNGTGDYLGSGKLSAANAAKRTQALDYAKTLDAYNNNLPCPMTMTSVTGVRATETLRDAPLSDKITVTAYPNPVTTGVVKFTILSPVSGKANLEVINMLGQRIQNVFNGSVEAGVKKSVDFNVPKAFTGNFMYILRVGDKTATGKLLQ